MQVGVGEFIVWQILHHGPVGLLVGGPPGAAAADVGVEVAPAGLDGETLGVVAVFVLAHLGPVEDLDRLAGLRVADVERRLALVVRRGVDPFAVLVAVLDPFAAAALDRRRPQPALRIQQVDALAHLAVQRQRHERVADARVRRHRLAFVQVLHPFVSRRQLDGHRLGALFLVDRCMAPSRESTDSEVTSFGNAVRHCRDRGGEADHQATGQRGDLHVDA